MSIQSHFTRAFANMREQLRRSHPDVKDVTFEIPGGSGSTLRVQVGVVMAGFGSGSQHQKAWEVEQVVKACLQREGLPDPTEFFFAAPEDLGGGNAHRHFFGKVAQ